MLRINADRLSRALFAISCIVLAFLGGILVCASHLFPYPSIRRAIEALPAQFGESKRLSPVRYDRVGVTIHHREAIAPGVTLLTGYWPDSHWGVGIRIIDQDGKVLHHWDIAPQKLWPKSHRAMANTYVHGTYLFPNGDILFNVEYLGIARLNACGDVVWKRSFRTHHSISRADSGDFWVSGMKWVENNDRQADPYPGLTPPYAEEYAFKISPDGKLLSEINVLKALYNSHYKRLLWKYNKRTRDVTHLNDVEELSERIAAQYPMFVAGDLLISLRYLSAIAVLSQDGAIKWLVSEPFNHQHDPDFEADGWITVFDNRKDDTAGGAYLGGSAIVAINPANKQTRRIFPTSGSDRFHTDQGGKHQLLDNGNRLITEAQAGRVFEVDPTGQLVAEWVQQPYDHGRVTEVLEGTRYNIPPAVIAGWPCGYTAKQRVTRDGS